MHSAECHSTGLDGNTHDFTTRGDHNTISCQWSNDKPTLTGGKASVSRSKNIVP